MEVKLKTGYVGKEDRYKTGKSKRLTHKFAFTNIDKFSRQFKEELDLISQEKLFPLKRKISSFFRVNGDFWTISGAGNYFPYVT